MAESEVLTTEGRIEKFYKICTKNYGDLYVWNNMARNVDNIVKYGMLGESLKQFANREALTTGVNIHDYDKTPFLQMYRHLEYQESRFKDLTDLDVDCLSIPRDFNVIGTLYGDGVIPVTAYRIGYNIHQILKVTDTTKRVTVLEIGGGFGLAGMIYKRKNYNSCYIIVDIASTAILSSYLLIKLGYKVYLYGESEEFDQEKLTNEYDFLILPPLMVKQLSDNSIDVVINTASLPEMSKDYIEYYIRNISRLAKCFYYDNNLHLNQPHLDKMCQEHLKDFSLILKQDTPINFTDPPFCEHPRVPFEERLYVK